MIDKLRLIDLCTIGLVQQKGYWAPRNKMVIGLLTCELDYLAQA